MTKNPREIVSRRNSEQRYRQKQQAQQGKLGLNSIQYDILATVFV